MGHIRNTTHRVHRPKIQIFINLCNFVSPDTCEMILAVNWPSSKIINVSSYITGYMDKLLQVLFNKVLNDPG